MADPLGFVRDSAQRALNRMVVAAGDSVQVGVPNADLYKQLLQKYDAKPLQENYNLADANRSRNDQVGALDMARSRLGNSVAGIQGQQAQGQTLQQALNAQSGRGVLGARQVGGAAAGAMGGIAGDVAKARLQEYLQAQQAISQGAQGLRAGDLQTASDQGQNQLGTQALRNSRQLASMAGQSELESLQRRQGIEQLKLYRNLQLGEEAKAKNALKNSAAGFVANAFGAGI